MYLVSVARVYDGSMNGEKKRGKQGRINQAIYLLLPLSRAHPNPQKVQER